MNLERILVQNNLVLKTLRELNLENPHLRLSGALTFGVLMSLWAKSQGAPDKSVSGTFLCPGSKIDSLALKSKRRGLLRRLDQELIEKHSVKQDVLKPDLLIPSIDQTNPHTVVQDSEWFNVESSSHPKESIVYSANQLLVDIAENSIANNAQPVTIDADEVKNLVKTDDYDEKLFDTNEYRGTADFMKLIKSEGFLKTAEASEPVQKGVTLKPFELKYCDKDGNPLSAKEAFKELSQRFHGTKPGKKKIDKKITKNRQRRSQRS